MYKFLLYVIASVWLVNGLYCKVLNLVPRHQEIVARILGNSYPRELSFMIGIFEIIMALWILSGFRSKFNAILQIFIIIVMNIIEFIYAPDLLLHGKFNIIFAVIFSTIIYLNEFYIKDLNAPTKKSPFRR